MAQKTRKTTTTASKSETPAPATTASAKRGSRSANDGAVAASTKKASTPAKAPNGPKNATSTEPTPRRGSQSVEPKPNLAHEVIAAKAYQLWLERGGSEADNWFEAERILRDQTMPRA